MRVLQPFEDAFAQTPGQVALEPEFVAAQPEFVAPVPQPPTYPLVVVHWLDAWYQADEQTEDEWPDEYPIRTVGYLVRDEPTVLSIAQEILPECEGFRAVTHIPRAVVCRIERLIAEATHQHPPAETLPA
jgi:hypothetical protein